MTQKEKQNTNAAHLPRHPWQWPSTRRVVWSLVVFAWGLMTGVPLGASLEIPKAFGEVLLWTSGGLMLVFVYGLMFVDNRKKTFTR